MLDNPQERKMLAENARKALLQYYDWEILLDKYENIYARLLKLN
jgi:glycosyltransferase involved in cell wall biosynthesis